MDLINLDFVKLSPNFKNPTKATQLSVGLDIYSPKDYILTPQGQLTISTGLRIKIPNANCFLLVSAVSGPFTSFLVLHTISWFPRSEVCAFVLGNICERFALRDLC